MEILTLDESRFVMVDGDIATVYSRLRLTEQIKQAQERLKQIPETPSDEELLEWARNNYPMMDYSKEKQNLEQTIETNSKLLESIK